MSLTYSNMLDIKDFKEKILKEGSVSQEDVSYIENLVGANFITNTIRLPKFTKQKSETSYRELIKHIDSFLKNPEKYGEDFNSGLLSIEPVQADLTVDKLGIAQGLNGTLRPSSVIINLLNCIYFGIKYRNVKASVKDYLFMDLNGVILEPQETNEFEDNTIGGLKSIKVGDISVSDFLKMIGSYSGTSSYDSKKVVEKLSKVLKIKNQEIGDDVARFMFDVMGNNLSNEGVRSFNELSMVLPYSIEFVIRMGLAHIRETYLSGGTQVDASLYTLFPENITKQLGSIDTGTKLLEAVRLLEEKALLQTKDKSRTYDITLTGLDFYLRVSSFLEKEGYYDDLKRIKELLTNSNEERDNYDRTNSFWSLPNFKLLSLGGEEVLTKLKNSFIDTYHSTDKHPVEIVINIFHKLRPSSNRDSDY